MGIIGEILEMTVEDGQVVCRVQTGTNQEVSAIMLLPLGVDAYPMIGDSVLCHNVGQEWVAVAGDSGIQETAEGECRIFSRNGTEVSASAHLKSDGTIEISNNSQGITISNNSVDAGSGSGGEVALASPTEGKIQAIVDAITNAAIGSADGGAAFKTNIIAALNIDPRMIAEVKSTNLKAE